MMEDRIYLASPYSSPDPAVHEQRYRAVCCIAAMFMRHGAIVFSPIVHGHPLSSYGLPTDYEYWQKHCLSFLQHWATKLMVCQIPGWQDSRGVAAEIAEAERLNLSVVYYPVTTVGGCFSV